LGSIVLGQRLLVKQIQRLFKRRLMIALTCGNYLACAPGPMHGKFFQK
jgi:hypothetical protein